MPFSMFQCMLPWCGTAPVSCSLDLRGDALGPERKMLSCRDGRADHPETLSDLVCRSASSLSASFDRGDISPGDTCSCASTFLNPPSLAPLQSIGGVTIGGAYGVSPGLRAEVDTSLFVVCCGDIQPSRPLHLSPIDLCVELGELVSHQRDFSLFHTSFVTLGHSELDDRPPILAIPHSLGLPSPLSLWTQHRYRLDWRRRWLKDVSRFPIQAVVSNHVESLSLHESLSGELLFWMEEWGPDDAEVEAAMAYLQRLGAREHRYDTDSDVTEVDSLSSSDVDSFTSSETCSSVHFTDSIEDLVGTEWLLHERWASEIY